MLELLADITTVQSVEEADEDRWVVVAGVAVVVVADIVEVVMKVAVLEAVVVVDVFSY